MSWPVGWCVYLLRCQDDSLYCGATNDLVARLKAHQSGKGARYTRAHLPVSLAYAEACADRSSALKREAAIKKLSRADKLALVQQWQPAQQSQASALVTAG